MEARECSAWLEDLLTEKFFNACLVHEDVKKNEKNIFCIDCCSSICPLCLPSHTSHRLLRIWRYIYNDVLRVEDCSKLMDCSWIQPYITNSSKVVFINERPQSQSRQFRGSGNFCNTCARSLQYPYLFCSLSCKIRDVKIRQKRELSFLQDCTTATNIVRKKRSSLTTTCRRVTTAASSADTEAPATILNRRKNTPPQRAPLY